MTTGVGNLVGYLGVGWWFSNCTHAAATRWPLFWSGLAGGVAVVMVYFLVAYHGIGVGFFRAGARRTQEAPGSAEPDS